MAMHGVLFLDELPEFHRKVLEVLREPLESGRISIARAARQAEFPAEFLLVAAMNPCPCGYLGHANGRCHCTPEQVARYRSRVSGPLLDRIDLQVEVPAVTHDELGRRGGSEGSVTIRRRVAAARAYQLRRQGKPNASLSSREVDRFCLTDAQGVTVLKQAIARLGLSARGYHRVLKVARSIADIEKSRNISSRQIAEAIQYRRYERMA